MDLTISRTSYGADDQSWLGSAHATDAAQTITLDFSTFNTQHYPDGWLVSGLPLKKTGETAGGQDLYGLYSEGDGEEADVLAGFLFTPVKLPHDTNGHAGAAILEHGRVKVGRLPVSVSEAAQATAAGRIIFA